MDRQPKGPNELFTPAGFAAAPWDRASQSAPARLVLLPGLGANRLLYVPQLDAAPSLVVPTWLRNRRGESLDSYARRLADHVRETVDLADSFALGGVSFGAMIAAEMARHLRPSCVLLIGGCRSPGAVVWPIRLAARLGHVLPDWWFRLLLDGPIPWTLGWTQDIPAEHRRLLGPITTATDIGFTKWAAGALAAWDGTPKDDLPCPVYHVHGSRDRIIPAKRVEVTDMIDGARHLVNLSHAEQVNAFLRRHTPGRGIPIARPNP